jgi:hypothetical protein
MSWETHAMTIASFVPLPRYPLNGQSTQKWTGDARFDLHYLQIFDSLQILHTLDRPHTRDGRTSTEYHPNSSLTQHISARADEHFPHKPSDVRAVTPQDRKSAGVFIISIDSGAPEGGQAETLAALGGEPLPVLSTSSKHSIPCP